MSMPCQHAQLAHQQLHVRTTARYTSNAGHRERAACLQTLAQARSRQFGVRPLTKTFVAWQGARFRSACGS